MKVLFVSSGNSGSISPFVKEQGESLQCHSIDIDYFLIKGRGIIGYLKNLPILIEKIKSQKYDLIHAHYGLSGLLCVLQRKVPVIVTFHGGDIYQEQSSLVLLSLSWLSSMLSSWNIFVNQKIPILFKIKKYKVIPCGINFITMQLIKKNEARIKLDLEQNKKYVLFSSAFDNKIKNYFLAKQAMYICDLDVNLLELKGYSRKEVALLMNAVDLLLLTSISEGSPQVIKEAMACNCPIVSTDVGDVKEVIGNTEGCYISSYKHEDVAEKIKMALAFGKRTKGRDRIISMGLDSDSTAKKIINLYKKVIR